MIKNLKMKIHGQVQDVNFRYYTRKKAQELGLVGYVRNDADDGVVVVAEGEEEKLKELLEWCKRGPVHAEVSLVEEKWEEANKSFNSFEII